MAQIGQCWAQPSWADDVWGSGTWGAVTTPATDTPPARTAGGGPTGTKHRKRYLFPAPVEEDQAIVEQALTAAEEEDDSEMLDVIAAYMANEDLF